MIEMMTLADVEAALVEAVQISWRLPDRERGWQRQRVFWPEMQRHIRYGDYDARGGDLAGDAGPLRPASLTRAEVARMETAFGWLDVVAPADRKLIGLVLRQLASEATRADWRALLDPMGVSHGSDGLRKRYGRSMHKVCMRANAGEGAATRQKPLSGQVNPLSNMRVK